MLIRTIRKGSDFCLSKAFKKNEVDQILKKEMREKSRSFLIIQ